jgi:hypothetical protein
VTFGKKIAAFCGFTWICGTVILVECWLHYPLPSWGKALVLSTLPVLLITAAICMDDEA